MHKDKIKELGEQLAKGVKNQKDLSDIIGGLTKTILEAILNAELDSHLGYKKHSKSAQRRQNTRNGFIPKVLKTDKGDMEIRTPRDRESTFEPLVVPKGKTRLEGFEDTILSLYSRGMTVRDIQRALRDLYNGAEISTSVISNVTDAVRDAVREWQNRPLDSTYPLVFLDCIVVKVREDNRIVKKSIYLALAVTEEGCKDVLGIWIAETESAKFWLSVLTELKNRGVKDVFIFCVDGLSGFPQAIEACFPQADVQLCIVHMVRNSLRYVAAKDKRALAQDLKKIYHSVSVNQAEEFLDEFCKKWSEKYPSIEKSWRTHWENLVTMFNYPMEIRKAFYTTNAIESLNSVIRKAIRNRKIFPSDQSALKVVYLAIQEASQRWTMPIRDWTSAMNRFAIEYEGRFDMEKK